jgi:hypothetical protein
VAERVLERAEQIWDISTTAESHAQENLICRWGEKQWSRRGGLWREKRMGFGRGRLWVQGR